MLDGRARVASFEMTARFRCPEASVTVIQGPNGSGKTTLLRIVAGLTGLESGTLIVDGTTVDDPTEGRWVGPVDRSVGFVPTDGVLFGHMSVLDNVAYGPRRKGATRDDARHRAGELLEALDADTLATQRPAALSSGETQRVALARALAVEPRLILLDEAFSAMDTDSRPVLRERVLNELRPPRSVVLLVTHDADEAAASADQILSIENGHITDGHITD